jgi:Spy/CpxP family protein refolding chaperone
MRAIRCAVVALLVAGVVAVVGAQPPRQQGGRGGGGDVNALVLTNTALQEELKITDSQKEKFKAVADKQAELNKKRGELFSKGGKGGDKDKRAELQEEGKKVAEEVKKVLDAELTAAQKKRLKQVGVQALGVNAFADPEAKSDGGRFGGGFNDSQKAAIKEVGEALKLTDSQKTKIKELTDEYSKDRSAIRKDVFGDGKGGGFDPEKQKDYAAKSGKLATETLTKITAVLDDAQKKTWKELTGDVFDTTKLNQPRTPRKD